ncbi:uncharacterized protein [Parasteatoda tepidariorum]|uniref:uncharacterized protein n=1 Tax=Parasteatoda tepidariorum TaxID=114398 RepID=UPI001C71D988|nr:uncharacterized protein LOC122272139 [Parasteatoda tepidariorum]
MDQIPCCFCETSFSQKKNFYRHLRNSHQDVELSDLKKFVHFCAHCKLYFKFDTELSNHREELHSSDKKAFKSSLKCGLCDEGFRFIKCLIEHIEVRHQDFRLEKQTLVFSKEEDFFKWKNEIESSTLSSYIKKCGDRTLTDESITNSYYCHRSGAYDEKKERSRRVKSLGSNKIGVTCPAHMTVKKQKTDTGTIITVFYQASHIGHSCEVGRVPISKEQKVLLASQMSSGVPKSRLLYDIRQAFSPTKRLSLTNNKDLHNICRDFRVDEDVILDVNENVSVQMHVHKLREEGQVLIYKPKEEELSSYPCLKKDDFYLGMMNSAQLKILQMYGNDIIMIDSTHGTNQQGYLLTTIMVNDSNHEGFPVATLYSSRVSADVLEPFFKEIKMKYEDFKPRVFMSDDDPALYNSFKWKINFFVPGMLSVHGS